MNTHTQKSIVIAAYVRSPFAPAVKGELARVRPDELAAQVVRALISRSGVKPDLIEDLIMGCAFPEAEQGFNIARLVTFLAELPPSIAGTTVNRFCGSSMQAIHMAAGAISMNAGEAFICAGIESMSRIPMTGYNPMPHPGLYESYPQAYMGMGETAENLVAKYNISRQAQDQFAVDSHRKADKARSEGKFKEEIIAIERPGDSAFQEDSCIRPNTSLETLAALQAAFSVDGSVTAGTSSPLTDGAVAVLVCTEEFADKHQLDKVAKIKSFAVSGCLPEIMGIGPVEATRKALKRAGLSLEQMDVIELNEAFSSQSLAVLQDLDPDNKLSSRINIDGGALALGHPLGATGARITGKAASILKREGGQYALATQCIGGGQGIATILERI
tara:strand:+ start:5626 stop:6789 length:1164 start_codon:yes stop_codon:yes gene_type:complete